MKKPLRQVILETWSSENFPRAACVLLRRKDGKFLAVSRKDDPTDFGLPGGKVDPGETDEQAARRELQEETGLEAGDIRFLYGGVCPGGKKDGIAYWTTTYVGDFEGEIHTEEEGVVKWVEPEVLLRGSFGEYNRRLFDTLGVTSLDDAAERAWDKSAEDEEDL
jgi:8-oxo-dGTP pyrophosphatase MutT (NUDIX family)